MAKKIIFGSLNLADNTEIIIREIPANIGMLPENVLINQHSKSKGCMNPVHTIYSFPLKYPIQLDINPMNSGAKINPVIAPTHEL